ncbi:MAG: rRNA maturation RNase YbeY [Bacteroidales bacterium]|nr:rRNA maturation RNase YbeY [Bacteroidales bacterium]
MNIFYDYDEGLEINEEKISDWLGTVIINENKSLGEIVFRFIGDEELLEINREYLQHDYYTDIITFDNSYLRKVSGEIFISIDRIKENAESENNKFLTELYRIIVHGILHLCGYKDGTSEEKRLMTEKEDTYLTILLKK